MSIAPANPARVCSGAAIITRPGAGSNAPPRPDTRLTLSLIQRVSLAIPCRVAPLTPVDGFAARVHLFKRAGDQSGARTGDTAAELPQLAGGALVSMDQIIEVEGVQLSGVVAG